MQRTPRDRRRRTLPPAAWSPSSEGDAAFGVAPDVLEAMALDRLSHGDARLPRTWSTIRSYERLVAKGMARELDDPNPLLRVFTRIKSEE